MKEKRIQIKNQNDIDRLLKMFPHISLTLQTGITIKQSIDDKGRIVEEAFFETASDLPIELKPFEGQGKGIHKYIFEYGKNHKEMAMLDANGEYVEDEFGIAAYLTEFNEKREIEIESCYDKSGELEPMVWMDNEIYYLFIKKDKEGRKVVEAYFNKEQMLTKNSSNKAYAVEYFYKGKSKKSFAEALYSHSVIMGAMKHSAKKSEVISAEEAMKLLSPSLALPLPKRMYEWLIRW